MLTLAQRWGWTLVFAAIAAPAEAQWCNGRTLTNSGAITPGTEAQYVAGSVTATEGDYYTVNVCSSGIHTFTFCYPGWTADYDTYLCVFDSGWNLIASNDDVCDLKSELTLWLGGGSTYYLAVSGLGSSAGSYALKHTAGVGTFVCNSRCQTLLGTITPTAGTQYASGSVTSASGARYQVNVCSTGMYTFTLCAPGSANYDSYLCLFDGNGNIVTQNDDACGSQSQIITWLTAGSTTYIGVSGFGAASGSFTLAYTGPAGTMTCNARCLSAAGTLSPTCTTATTSGFISLTGGALYTISPINTGSHRFTLCAPGSAGFDSYLCLFDGSGNLITSNDDTCGTQAQITSTLSSGTTYYLSVSGFGASSGPYTLAYSFVDTTFPPMPPAVAPADGSCVSTATPTFDWWDVTDPCGVTYDLQVDDSGFGFPSPVINVTGLGSSAYTPVAPLSPGTYTWHARAVDGAGNQGVWSVARTVIVDNGNPAAPIPTSPANGLCSTNATPTFDWSDVTDPCGIAYDIQADNSGAGFSSPEINVSGLATSLFTSAALSPGTYSWRARAVDSLGNVGAWSFPAFTYTIDTAPPVGAIALLSPLNAVATNDNTPSFDWSDVVDSCGVGYQIQIDNSGLGFPTPEIDQSNLAASAFTPAALPDAPYYWRVRAIDGAGNPGAWSAVLMFTVDTTPPLTPAAPDLLSTSDSGPSSTDNITNDVTPTFTGSAEPNAIVTLRAGAVSTGSATADAGGAYTITSMSLVDATYDFTVVVTDAATNTSLPSPPLTVKIDSAIATPAAPVLDAASDTGPADGITSDATPTFTGTVEPNATVTLQQDLTPLTTATAGPTGAYSITAPAMGDGDYNFTVSASDAAGNTSPTSFSLSVTIDTLAPAPPTQPDLQTDTGVSSTDNVTNDLTPGFTGTAEPDIVVSLRIGVTEVGAATADAAGAYTVTSIPIAADGVFTFTAVAIDLAGNSSPDSISVQVTIDTAAPAPPTLSAPADASCTANPSLSLDWSDVADPSGIAYDLQVDDSGPAFSSPEVDASNLPVSLFITGGMASATYSWRVRAVDVAGNPSPWSSVRTVTVDTVSPSAPALLAPANGPCTNDAAPVFDWSDVADPCGVTYQLQVDDSGAAFASPEINQTGLATSTFTPAPLPAASYVWRTRAFDGAGNPGAWSAPFVFTIDTTPPASAPVLLTPANGATANTNVAFDWSDIADMCGVTYEIQIDDSDPTFPSPEIAQADVATSSFTPAATPPNGSYFWRVRAVDGGGNPGPWAAPFSFSLDATPPATPAAPDLADASDTGTSSTDNITSITTPTLAGLAEADISVTLYANGTPVGTTTSDATGNYTIASSLLPAGTYDFTVIASDAAGNTSPASTSLTVIIDTSIATPAAPALDAASDTGLSSSDGVTNDTTPTLTGAAEASASVILRNGAVQVGAAVADAAGAYAITLAPLADGAYSFTVTASDAAGNASSASLSLAVAIDTAAPAMPPAPALEGGASLTSDSTPGFTGTAEPNVRVVLREGATQVGTATAGPTGAYTVTASALPDGTYSFTVTVTDAAGNEGPPSPALSVTIDTTAPAPPTPFSPANGSCAAGASLSLDWSDIADPSGITYEVHVDDSGAAFPSPEINVTGLAASAFTTEALPEATYSWRARAVDGAGNPSPWSSVWTTSVDTSAPSAPLPVSPAGTSCTDTLTPAFDWSDVADPCGVTYQIQIDDSGAAFATPEIDQAGLAVSTFVPSPLPAGTYVWRVRALDGMSNQGPWSSTFTLAIDTVAASAPSLLAPADVQCTSDSSPAFDWSDVTDPCGVTYELQVDDSGAAFPSPEIDATGLAASTFSPTLAEATYVWRVRTIDGAGNAGAWSTLRTLTIDTAAPPAPLLTAPADATFTGDPTPSFDWTDVTDACGVTYDFQIDDSGVLFPSPEVDLTGLTTSDFAAGALPEGGYSWRARAVDGAGNPGSWSAARSFTIDTTPPPAPTALEQYFLDGTTPLPWGGGTLQNSVVLEANVTDVPASNTVRLHVEVTATGSAFSGTPDASSSFLAAGSTVKLTVNGLPDGNYMWRAWAEDSMGQVSPTADFNGAAGADFSVDLNDPPTAPSSLGQCMLDGTTSIAVGGTTPESGVVLKATVSDPEGNSVRAIFEVKPTAVSFDETGLVIGTWASSGGVSQTTVPIALGDYHWRVRAEDAGGLAGAAWSEFGDNVGGDFERVSAAANAAPDVPSNLSQGMTDGVTSISVGGTTTESSIVLRGTVFDADGQPCALQVEVKPALLSFDGTGLTRGPFTAGGLTAQVSIPVASGGYHWRARAVDSIGATSEWLSFGGNPDGEVDFTATSVPNQPPALPTDLGQRRLNGVTAIPEGGSTNELAIMMRAILTDPDVGNGVALEVELRPVGSPFMNMPSATGAFASSGAAATVTVSGLTLGASYRWQARAVDTFGAASGWVAYGAGIGFEVSGSNAAPSAAAPAQLRSDHVTAIPAGGTTNERTVVLQAAVSDTDSSSVRLDVEVVPSSAAFTGAPTASSAFVADGSTAEVVITGLLAGTAYRWRYRAADSGGATGAWTDYGAGDPDFILINNSAPDGPTGLSQRRLSGISVIPLGGSTGQTVFRAFAAVGDPDGSDLLRLQVEAKPSASAFDGTGLVSGSPAANGTVADVTVPLPAMGFHHWRVRAVDQTGTPGPWVDFDASTANHLQRAANTVPAVSGAGQFHMDGATPIPLGATSNEVDVYARAVLTDADEDDVGLEVEVRPVGEAFTDSATHVSGLAASGSPIVVALRMSPGAYHWQLRAVDQSGNASAWTAFGANADPGDADFQIVYGGNDGHKKRCSASVPGATWPGSAAITVLWLLLALRTRPRARRWRSNRRTAP
ncbi:MAG: hypothetical protein HYY16_19000 [Planctomycetes bacterium]|nr:hypothetical protein [Planctomycetota bacterium]